MINEYLKLLTLAESAAIHGARRMIELAEKPSEIKMEWKADKSMVLSLDLASNEEIRKTLTGQNLVSEEDPDTHAGLNSFEPYFVIDPLDGTHSCRRMLKNHGRFISGQIGFGPMIGVIEKKRLKAVTFLSLTERKLFSAIHGAGAFECEWAPGSNVPSFQARKRLTVAEPAPLKESAVLYYPGFNGEMDLVKRLRQDSIVENVYRFGGFANDCARLARGYEQIHVQLSLKAWDLPAALLAIEAGYSAIFDPTGRRVGIADWDVSETNPLMMVHKLREAELIKQLYG